jgi:hypothetical protein
MIVKIGQDEFSITYEPWGGLMEEIVFRIWLTNDVYMKRYMGSFYAYNGECSVLWDEKSSKYKTMPIEIKNCINKMLSMKAFW